VLSATIIDYLDDHAGAFTAILTLALVAVTVFYAIQNRMMVLEMQRTRNAALVPKLAIDFHRLAPATMTVAILNVGPGAALDVDVRVVFEPPSEEAAASEFRWRRNVLSAGERAEFMQPGELNNNLNTLPAAYRAIRLVGTTKDATGTTHPVNESFEGLAEWREVLHGAKQRYTEPDIERRLADALLKKFERPIGGLQKSLDNVARSIGRLAPPERDDEA
jgi:hypothetical protein